MPRHAAAAETGMSDTGRVEAAEQHPGCIACAALLGLAGYTALYRRPASKASAGATLACAYLYNDLWLNVLHMFLDREENLQHGASFIRDLARLFQIHHADPVGTVTTNHMADIDVLVTTTIGCLVLWHWLARRLHVCLPRHLYLWTLAVVLTGELAIYNHSLMHARTRGVAIPHWVAALQDWGVLVAPSSHREHHTTFETDFRFLVGFGRVYDALYRRLPRYDLLQVMFFGVLPHTVVSIVGAIGIGRAARSSRRRGRRLRHNLKET